MALRQGELSLLYPVASLTYVWTMGLAAWRLKERLNAQKVIGLLLVLVGIGVMHLA
jgi:uncharacterized membrane protein